MRVPLKGSIRVPLKGSIRVPLLGSMGLRGGSKLGALMIRIGFAGILYNINNGFLKGSMGLRGLWLGFSSRVLWGLGGFGV